ARESGANRAARCPAVHCHGVGSRTEKPRPGSLAVSVLSAAVNTGQLSGQPPSLGGSSPGRTGFGVTNGAGDAETLADGFADTVSAVVGAVGRMVAAMMPLPAPGSSRRMATIPIHRAGWPPVGTGAGSRDTGGALAGTGGAGELVGSACGGRAFAAAVTGCAGASPAGRYSWPSAMKICSVPGPDPAAQAAQGCR